MNRLIDCAMTERLPGAQEYYDTLDELGAPSRVSGRVTLFAVMSVRPEYSSPAPSVRLPAPECSSPTLSLRVPVASPDSPVPSRSSEFLSVKKIS